jgi:hypothetical protein
MSIPDLPPPPPPPSDVPRIRRTPLLVGVGAGLLVVAAISVVLATRSHGSSEAAASPSATAATPTPSIPPPPATVPGYPLNWRRFDSAEGGFTVVGPGIADETFARGVHGAHWDEPGEAFAIYWFDEPGPARSDVSLLVFQKNRLLNDVGGKVTRRGAITIDLHPGPALRIEGRLGGEEFFYIMRLYVVDGRFFQIAASIRPDPAPLDLTRADLFLESFALS